MKHFNIGETTMEKKNRLYHITMVLCFVYAGISLLLLIYQIYFLIRRGQAPPINIRGNESINISRFAGRRWSPFSPIDIISSSLGLIISLLAGFSLMDLLKKKEQKELTKNVINTMLTPEEKTVIQVLEENDDELPQSELVSRTKLSKVKISRIIKRLESLKVISKYPYGMTNKIKLERKIN